MFSMHTRRRIVQVSAVLLGVGTALLLQPTVNTRAAVPGAAGAPIIIAGDETEIIDVFGVNSKPAWQAKKLEHFPGKFTIDDRIAVGDVNGDGVDEIVVAGDVTQDIDIFDLTGIHLKNFQSSFTKDDGLAVGDIDGNGISEIIIAGNKKHMIDIFDKDGNRPYPAFYGNYYTGDGFAVGDVNGDGWDEILVAAGNNLHTIDIFDWKGDYVVEPVKVVYYSAGFGFAVGNVNGTGPEEIVIGQIGSDLIYVLDMTGKVLKSFPGYYTENDGFAVGDVDGNGIDDILVAGDRGHVVDIFNMQGTPLYSFDGDFTENDGFAVGTMRYPDKDGDGLLDHWETDGLDVDNDGFVDVNLPAMGASPDHQDVFLELDYVTGQAPSRQDIQAMKAAFAAAPVDNLDGLPGIRLWVDTGSLVDWTAYEGAPLNTCLDGLDNNGNGLVDSAETTCQNMVGQHNYLETAVEGGWGTCDNGFDDNGNGLIDVTDPACLVGDNLGGGNAITLPVGCLDSVFYSAKKLNFSPARARVFHYAISGSSVNNTSCKGGRAEIGGNDFVDFNHDAGTIMHLLGHNLNLRHGGDDDNSCKPNYVSVMNHDLQLGIPQVGGGLIVDYSGPRSSSGRGLAPLLKLVENDLSEAIILDPTDLSNRFIFVNMLGQKVQSPLNGDVTGDGVVDGIDWNGDGSFTGSTLVINIDTSDTGGHLPQCTNGSFNSTLVGHDDWSNISLPFRQFGDWDEGALNPWLGPEPDLEELYPLQTAIKTTDLAITISDSVDPVQVGREMVYTLQVSNNGPNPASAVQVVDELPAGVTYVAGNAPCVKMSVSTSSSGQETFTCYLAEVLPYTAIEINLTVQIDPNFLSNPYALPFAFNTVRVEDLTGPSKDTATEATWVVP
ncbi:MAG: DUF11 domain-containing protein [Anaerolineae bacterium]|nr:DUF11 domain-containing protein [Anaerolineae bacterium]